MRTPEAGTNAQFVVENDELDEYISTTLDRMIESLAVYRNSPDELGEYDENIRRRRKNDIRSFNKQKVPKIKAIMAIIENRRIDNGRPSQENLREMPSSLDSNEQVKRERSLKIDKFFK